jgi:GrpB-like predicted nucleotidyltransferase (UPF0157 family)
LSDWEVETSAAGGIASIRVRGSELLAEEARPLDASAARWRVAADLDRLRVVPQTFELAQSMVWPFRHEPGMEVVLRGKNLMPLAPSHVTLVEPGFTLRLSWPSSGLAVSIAWDELRLSSARVEMKIEPPRIEVHMAGGGRAEVRPVSWWVDVRDGSGTRTVEVVEYDKAWPDHFRHLAAELIRALGDQFVAIEHGGSTAVPGLAAKPIVDIWAALRSPIRPEDIEAMAAIGFDYLGEAALEDQDFFVKLTPPVCHLHCYPEGHPLWYRHLAFRDWLRADSEGAAAYGRLKRDLAIRFAADRLAYTEAKSDFIEAALLGQKQA